MRIPFLGVLLQAIIYKINLNAGWSINCYRKQNGLSFMYYNHGDHLRIIHFSNDKGTNAARQRTRIGKFLLETPSGLAEHTITAEKIKLLERFSAYCSRYSPGTMRHFGSATRKNSKNLYNNIDNTQKPLK